MNETVLRLTRLFNVVTRPADLNTLVAAKIHFMAYDRLGDGYERTINDMESRYLMDLQKWDNWINSIEISAIQRVRVIEEAVKEEATTKKKEKK
jgi:hypothetical protein